MFFFFHRIKDIFFIVTNSFIALDILSMPVKSHYQLLAGTGQGVAKHLPFHMTVPQQRITSSECQQDQGTSQTTSDMFDQSQHLLHAPHKSFLSFSCAFTFLEIKKCSASNVLCVFFHSNIKMTAQKFILFDFFKMQADMTIITIQSNKIV